MSNQAAIIVQPPLQGNGAVANHLLIAACSNSSAARAKKDGPSPVAAITEIKNAGEGKIQWRDAATGQWKDAGILQNLYSGNQLALTGKTEGRLFFFDAPDFTTRLEPFSGPETLFPGLQTLAASSSKPNDISSMRPCLRFSAFRCVFFLTTRGGGERD